MGQFRDGPRLQAGRPDAPDAAAVLALAVVRQQVGPALGRQPGGVFDHVAVHVGDPHRAVRTGAHHDRSAPAVLAGEEIELPAHPLAAEAHPVLVQSDPLHEVVEGFADEGGGVGAQPFVAVDRAAASRGVAPLVVEAMVAFLRLAGGMDRRLRGREHHDPPVRRGEVGVAAQIVVGQDIVPERTGVLRAEPVAPVVAVAPELRRPGGGFQLAGVGPETEVAAADLDVDARAVRGEHGALGIVGVVPAGSDVDPAVEPPAQAVGAELLVALAEPGDEFLDVAVLADVEHVRRGGDQSAVAPGHDAVGKVESGRDDLAGVVGPVRVGVGQHPQPAAAFAAVGVVGHLGHPEPAVGVPVEGDRIHDQRLGRDEVEFEALRHMDRLLGVSGIARLALEPGARRRDPLGGREMRPHLLGAERSVVDRDLVDLAFETREAVAASAEEDPGPAGGQRPGDLGFDFRNPVEVDRQLVAVADQDDVMPVAEGEFGAAVDDGADLVAGVEEQPAGNGVLGGATDAEVFADRLRVAVAPAREQVAGDGAGVGREAVPEPEFDAVAWA